MVKRGVGMFVAPGAQAPAAQRQRNDFISKEWPEIRDRMARLGIDPDRAACQRERLRPSASAGTA